MNDNQCLLLGIGAQKAGTTWLAEQLRLHPNCFVPAIKELHHFDSIHRNVLVRHRNNRIRLFKRISKNLSNKKLSDLDFRLKLDWIYRYSLPVENNNEWYLSLFDDKYSAKENPFIKCDITPEYSIINEKGFSDMLSVHSNIKVVFMLREPISRSWSALKYFNKNNPEKNIMDSEESIIDFLNQKDTLQRSDYLSTIKILKKYLKPENYLIDFYENIFRSSDSQFEFLEKICALLGINFDKNLFEKSISQRINPSTPKPIPSFVYNNLRPRYSELNKELESQLNMELPKEWK